MTKPKTLEQLRAETQLAQEQHKLNRLENRKKYLEKGERQNAPIVFAIWAARRLSETQDSPLLLLSPTVPGSDCIASITANTATTPARAA